MAALIWKSVGAIELEKGKMRYRFLMQEILPKKKLTFIPYIH